MRTKRDQDILNFVTDFHIATSNQIHRLFFADTTYQYSRKRLRYLVSEKVIKHTDSTIDNCYAYYIDKMPRQIHHDLIRAETFVNLKERFKIIAWENEEPILNIRPDAVATLKTSAFAYINDHDILFPILVEIHLGNRFNFEKYEQLVKRPDFKNMFAIPPRVLICTDRHVTPPSMSLLKFKVINFNNMSGLDGLFK